MKMNLLSFDIGIKNLAMCLLKVCDNEGNEDPFVTISKWEVFDLSGEKPECNFIVNTGTNTNTISCESDAKYYNNDQFFCKKHSKHADKTILPDDLHYNELKKQKLSELCNIANKYNISLAKTKNMILDNIRVYSNSNFLLPVKNVKADELNLVDIGIMMRDKLDATLTHDVLSNIDGVIIENQISPLAGRMKTLQGMLAQYFIMKNITNIIFYSAMNKLKIFGNLTTISYAERKKMSVNISKELLSDNKSINEWTIYFLKHKKKDDLADSFLQGLSYFVKEKILPADKFNKFFD